MGGTRSACMACSFNHTWQRQKSRQGYSLCNAAWKILQEVLDSHSLEEWGGIPWGVVCGGPHKLSLTLLSQLHLSKKLWSSVSCCAGPGWRCSTEHLGSQQPQWKQLSCALDPACLWLADVSLSISLKLTVKESQQGDLWESAIKNDTWKKDRNLLKRME